MLKSNQSFINILALSEELLLHVKLKKDILAIEKKLRTISRKDLLSHLNTDKEKKAFWINIYNAYYQILAVGNNNHRKHIFSKKDIIIAQTPFSLDDIEHGILRKYRWKHSFGYLPNPFASMFIRKLAVKKMDYRIHFALNCGAKSCPPIAFYSFDNIDKQLDDAMISFIETETIIYVKNKIISTSKLMYWYQGDFGGIKGVKRTLKTVFKIDMTAYQLKFNSYSWESQLENYAKH